ncbi:MAG: GNAT family N-acetyltransferase [Desulfovibrio sp.]|nr:GNAT family N-acetyltransferase [Desulfovibrio sp.]
MSAASSPLWLNLLEPPAFAELFLRHPPQGFAVGAGAGGLPLFRARLNLLTTLDRGALARLRRLPLFTLWSRRLSLSACFAGTTITEYAPLPGALSPEELLDILGRERDASLVILKDLPDQSPLLPEEDNALAGAVAAEAGKRGWLEIRGQALAYVPLDFAAVDDYLARLSPARRRDLRRKNRRRGQLEVERLPLGDARFFRRDFLDELYAQYLAVFAQSDIHFDLLSRDFFAALLQSRELAGVTLLYRRRGALAGYNICLIHKGRLLDKYIGFSYPLAREMNLYFLSWLVNLEFALENGLTAYVAGWTDPEVKASLGAAFTFTRHLVLVRHPLLRRLLSPLRGYFEADRKTIGDIR